MEAIVFTSAVILGPPGTQLLAVVGWFPGAPNGIEELVGCCGQNRGDTFRGTRQVTGPFCSMVVRRRWQGVCA